MYPYKFQNWISIFVVTSGHILQMVTNLSYLKLVIDHCKPKTYWKIAHGMKKEEILAVAK